MSLRNPPPVSFFASQEARRMAGLCGLALILIAVALYQRTIGFGFLYLRDDDVNIAMNPHMGGLTQTRLAWMFTDFTFVRRYIPLGWLNFCATYEVAGLDPAPYHAVGVAFYALNCGLVFVVLMQLLRMFRGATAVGIGTWEAASAALAAAWWAFHPFRVETTAWISGNLYGQATALFLVAIAAYLRTYELSGGRRIAVLGISALLFSASLLTYPVALGMPVILVGIDFLQSRSGFGPPMRRLLLEKILFFVPVAGVLAVTLAGRFASTNGFGEVPGLHELPLASRLAQSAYVAAYYVWKPWLPLHLSPLYDTLMDVRATDPVMVLSMTAVAAASIAAIALFRKAPAFAVVWFGYLAAAAPFFGLTEKPHMASDRYGCLLAVIMAGVLALALAHVVSPRSRAWAFALSLCVIATLGCLTHRQLDVWTNDRVQHAYVARNLTNQELLDDFQSRQLILEFLRGNEGYATQAVAARLKAKPDAPGFRKAAAIIASKQQLGGYYGAATYLEILQEHLGLEFAKAGSLREANDHLGEALSGDDRFYQAAYDRSLVLLGLGRPEDALGSFLEASRWAPSGLPAIQRHAFLMRLRDAARSEDKPDLAHAADLALAR